MNSQTINHQLTEDLKVIDFFNEYRNCKQINIAQASRIHYKYVYGEEITITQIKAIASYFLYKGWKSYRTNKDGIYQKFYVNPAYEEEITGVTLVGSNAQILHEPKILELKNFTYANGSLSRQGLLYRKKVYDRMPKELRHQFEFQLTKLTEDAILENKKNKSLRLGEIEIFLEMVCYFKYPKSAINYYLQAVLGCKCKDYLLPNSSFTTRFYLPFDNACYVKELLYQYQPIKENEEFAKLRKLWESYLTINEEGSYYGW